MEDSPVFAQRRRQPRDHNMRMMESSVALIQYVCRQLSSSLLGLMKIRQFLGLVVDLVDVLLNYGAVAPIGCCVLLG
jgi:hypothetical protein